MAEGLRSRQLSTRSRAARSILLFAALPAACAEAPAGGGPPAPQGARRVALATIPPADVAAAVLRECHAPLMRRMQRVKATVTLPDGTALLVQADLPDRARVQQGRRAVLVRGDEVTALDGPAVADDEAARARDALAIVDAVAFGPLHRATSCRAAEAPGAFVVTAEHGDGGAFALHPDTLLPASVTTGGRAVRCDDYLRTATSWVVRRATLDGLGTCDVVFEDGGVVFPRDFFAPPDERVDVDGPRTIRMPIPGAVVETRSPTPIVVEGKATRLAVFDDPGDWAARHALYLPVHAALLEADQKIAGFPMLFDEGGAMRLAAPFRARGADAPFAPPPAWRVREVPAGRLLVVYPPDGDVARRIEAGRAQLARALQNRGLTAKGPIVAQPFVHLHEGAPSADRLAEAAVRVSVRIE